MKACWTTHWTRLDAEIERPSGKSLSNGALCDRCCTSRGILSSNERAPKDGPRLGGTRFGYWDPELNRLAEGERYYHNHEGKSEYTHCWGASEKDGNIHEACSKECDKPASMFGSAKKFMLRDDQMGRKVPTRESPNNGLENTDKDFYCEYCCTQHAENAEGGDRSAAGGGAFLQKPHETIKPMTRRFRGPTAMDWDEATFESLALDLAALLSDAFPSTSATTNIVLLFVCAMILLTGVFIYAAGFCRRNTAARKNSIFEDLSTLGQEGPKYEAEAAPTVQAEQTTAPIEVHPDMETSSILVRPDIKTKRFITAPAGSDEDASHEKDYGALECSSSDLLEAKAKPRDWRTKEEHV
ncbi:unnamed protein product [Amoebophrya sp. A25]|nr:unnamed protein product [Amoebophrya sp. A25]|eukprot:GSA25T00004617001.1